MKKILKKIYMLPLAAATLSMTSCLETVQPTDVASADQVKANSESFNSLVNGLKNMMTQYNTYGSGSGTATTATADWGYPNYMIWREVMCDAFPTTGASWNYMTTLEAGTYLTSYTAYPYYYYYYFINNTNNILKQANEESTTNTTVIQALGSVRTFRALCYMELSTMFEFYKTGISALDAEAADVMGLTVPIVTENTTTDEAKNNPRVPFYTMYRFIYSDLSKAAEDLKGAERSAKNDINEDVVNGLMARFWLNLATRFEKNSNDLQTQLSHEGDEDGYKDLGITNADQCYTKAQEYAQKVIDAGYTPMTEDQWTNAETGFNTAVDSWVWCISFTSTEQTPRYWCTITGIVGSEPTWGMPAYSGEYRCIGKNLYDKIGEGDWRKNAWVAPEDAGAKTVPSKYKTTLKNETSATTEDNTNFSRLPEYANLKFHPAGGNLVSEEDGLLVDIPLMRVEEMYFIKMECALHLQGLATAKSQLENFLNSYRYASGSYASEATTESGFVKEMIAQKYIEFWGEGIVFNDYKRLGLQVDRKYEGSNYLDTYKLRSYDGYAAPWMNFYIPTMERNFNTGIQMNPNPTQYVADYCK